ncbi:MAG: zf-HC2 domain-containing protein, partial [Elusimicrobia bacterium]|nr:zf-HC2 domain-containing protein [Elusimicrobiota bacterium]
MQSEKCRQIQEKLQELLDGFLGREESNDIQQHLKTCRACRGEYETLESVAASVAKIVYDEPGTDFNKQVMARLGLAA